MDFAQRNIEAFILLLKDHKQWLLESDRADLAKLDIRDGIRDRQQLSEAILGWFDDHPHLKRSLVEFRLELSTLNSSGRQVRHTSDQSRRVANYQKEILTEIDALVSLSNRNPPSTPVTDSSTSSSEQADPEVKEDSSFDLPSTDYKSGTGDLQPTALPDRPFRQDSLNTEAQVTRYTDISCPRRVWINTKRILVTVRLSTEVKEDSAASSALSLHPEYPLRVRIEAPAFNFLNSAEQTIKQPSDPDSSLVFDLQPHSLGATRITLDFFQAGNPLGTVSFPIEVMPDQPDEAPHLFQKSFRVSEQIVPPDRILYISYDQFQNQPAFSFTLIRSGEVGRTFHPVRLTAEPKRYIEMLYDRCFKLTNRQDPTAATVLQIRKTLPRQEVDRRFRQLGQNLWEMLIPQELKELYAVERSQWKDQTLLVVSDEPHIPWELVWAFDAKAGWQDENPWCVQMKFTRWLRRDIQGNGHEAPVQRLNLQHFACIAPSDSKLPCAQAERQFLRNVIQRYRFVDFSPAESSLEAVMNLLENHPYSWLHVAAHGNFYADSPSSDSAIWLQDQSPLTPDQFIGLELLGHIEKERPAFVFNACHAGRMGWDLTQLGGWANRLISNGAGLFIAPLWTVTDQAAQRFAELFYEELLKGSTVAEAVRQSREAIRQAGDPTWLAYSVYSHPNAMLIRVD